jgi:hypothetical protein
MSVILSEAKDPAFKREVSQVRRPDALLHFVPFSMTIESLDWT